MASLLSFMANDTQSAFGGVKYCPVGARAEIIRVIRVKPCAICHSLDGTR